MADIALSSAELDAIRDRHPDAFRRPVWKQFGLPIGILAIIIYSAFCWWFFSIGTVLGKTNWGIAGAYLADWVSYEIRPDMTFEDGYLDVSYPRFSPLGSHPAPKWVVLKKEMVTHKVEDETATGNSNLGQRTNTSSQTADSVISSQSSFMVQGSVGSDAATAVGGGGEADTGPKTVTENAVTHAAVTIGGASIVIVPDEVRATYEGRTLVVHSKPDKWVRAEGPLPSWATQKYADGKIVMNFGFGGRVEVETYAAKVRRRFLGWANFVFDTNSPFFDKPLGEVVSLIVSGPRLDPKRSNLALAWDNILNNAEWQHGDVWLKLMQTIVMAFAGTVLASIVAFPLSFVAARNITRNKALNETAKRFFDFQRSVDMLIWALFFTRAFGPGPLAGIAAIFFTDTGTLGKLYSEALENIDDKQREGVRSVGAAPTLVQRFGVIPQVLPVFASQALYFWESNTRSATIIGAVGAGGIGLKLWEAMRTNQNWENVGYMVILILIVVFIFDNISNMLRSRLIGNQS